MYAFDHSDGSCSYYRDGNKDIFYSDYDTKTDNCTVEEYRGRQLAQRMKDVEYLLKVIELKESKEIKSLDTQNMIYCGHSYGGMTALEA